MATITEPVDFSVVEGVGVATVDNPPRNTLSPLVRDGLDGAVKTALSDPDVSAIVLFCDGASFLSGDELDGADDPPLGTPLTTLLGRIEAADKPVVAALHGEVTGEGLELALCCHGRVAAADARFQFSEVKRGVLPGAGGTQRLPRLVGAERALSMMLWAEVLTAPEAVRAGLADALATQALLQSAMDEARRLAATGQWRRTSTLQATRHGDVQHALQAARRAVAARAPHSDAHAAILACVEAACSQSMEAGLQEEARQLLQLLMRRRAAD